MTSFAADTADFKRFAARLRDADAKVKKAVNKGLRDAALPVGRFVAVAAGRSLPQRGGLGYAIGGARPHVTATSQHVSIRFDVRERWYLARVDDGTIRHPVFNKTDAQGKRVMVDQHVQPGSFRKPFDQAAPVVRREMVNALGVMLDELARP